MNNNSYEQLKEENAQYTLVKKRLQLKLTRKIMVYSSVIFVNVALVTVFIILQFNLFKYEAISFTKESQCSLMRNELIKISSDLQNITAMKEAIEEQIEELNNTLKIKYDLLSILNIEQTNLKNKLRAIEETPNHFSNIILSYSDKRFVEKMTQLKFGKACYRSTRDTLDSSIFHSNCNEITPSITVIKTTEGIIFGGVTHQTWKGNGYKKDNEAFLFSLTLKKKYPVIQGAFAIYSSNNFFPCFGVADILMSKDSNIINPFFNSYENCSCPYEINDNQKTFGIEELEVFQLVDFY